MSGEDLVRLKKIFAGIEDRAILFLQTRGYLKPGEGLEHLDDRKVAICFSQPSVVRTVREFETDAEKAERRQAEFEDKRERGRRSRMDRLSRSIPAEYQDISVDGAPKPEQYEFVTSGDDLEPGKCGLFLVGESGTGKTAAAWALLQNAVESGEIAGFEFVKSTEFVRIAKAKHLGREGLEEFQSIFHPMLNTELLILDDLGSERISEGLQETFFELIDTRTEQHRTTVITSNSRIPSLVKAFGKNSAKIQRRLEQFFLVVNFDA